MIVLAHVSVSLAETIAGTITAVACFFVMLTFVLFKDLQNLRYVELVFYVSLNDFIGSIGIAQGSVPSGSAACWFQGISTTLNYLSSMFWITVISYQVWLIVYHRTVIKNMFWLHVICWGFPTLVALLPLTTNSYGNNSDDDSGNWCFIASRADSPSWGVEVWELISFYLWLWAAILTNIGFLVSVSLRFRKMAVVTSDVSVTMTKLVWYPAILIFCWSCSTALYFYYSYRPNDDDNRTLFFVDRFSTVVCILQGAFSSVAFFAFNASVRYKWKVLLYNLVVHRKIVLRDEVTVRNFSRDTATTLANSFGGTLAGSTAPNSFGHSDQDNNSCVYEGGRGSLDDDVDFTGAKSSLSEQSAPGSQIQNDVDYIEPQSSGANIRLGRLSTGVTSAVSGRLSALTVNNTGARSSSVARPDAPPEFRSSQATGNVLHEHPADDL